MRKVISIAVTICLLMACVFYNPVTVEADGKADRSREIAIVFDNSGSMYVSGNMAWCRATYAMEVFASMLNDGDSLKIYPMNPITVDGSKYTMENPLTITDAEQASKIRNIYSADAADTHIESIDCAAAGLKKSSANFKYLIVLTDGGTFYKNGHGLTKERTRTELDKRIGENAGKDMTMMYLGIGSSTCMPNSSESEYFSKKQANNSADILSTLTVMCNQIFGRDILPDKYISGDNIEFDIAMNKLIVFVQGTDISDLKMTSTKGKDKFTHLSSQQVMYSTKGAGDYKSIADKSLQGMIVTYTDCPAGSYEISYSGKPSDIEVYYEPAADLDFIFTDADGDEVDLDKLYEGDYKITYGMKDATTGKLIESDLLGNPHYEGSYTINGEKKTFSADGYQGEVPVKLNMGDSFKADLTATYLSGYTITKDASDFGWPEEGIKVGAPPLGKFKVELEVPQDYIQIKHLGDSKAMTAKLMVRDKPLESREFDAVKLNVDTGGIKYTATPDKENSAYIIQLEDTANIDKGPYDIKVVADYKDVADRTAKSDDLETIKLGNTPLWVFWAIRLGILLLLLLLILIILHLKRLPKHAHVKKRGSSMNFDGEDVSSATTFNGQMSKGNFTLTSKYGGTKTGISMSIKPGKDSYMKTAQKRRYAEVNPNSVRKVGSGTINDITIGSVRYVLNEDTNKLERTPKSDKPFELKNGMRISYSGTVVNAGQQVPYTMATTLNFNKKK